MAAASLAGVEEVLYVSRKPPAAWRGTAAEDTIDLCALTEQTIFFEGTAQVAARMYLKNANVAAAIALCGPGFERTRVRLVADPNITRNIHEINLRSAATNMTLQIESLPSADNSKTSAITGYSLASELLKRIA